MRNRFDQLGKLISKEALGASGPTVAHDEISPEAQYADIRHEPDPACAAERERLGLLGQIASTPCLIELYSHTPDGAEFRACLGKHLAFWQQRARKTRARKQPQSALVEPSLWVVAAGTPTALMAKLKLAPAPGWPPGVYLFGDDVLRVGLVAASQLPRERSTLLVRLMAAGPLLPHAIVELSALPKDAHERIVADQILLRLHHALEKKPSRTPEEQEFSVIMENTWEKARELGEKQGQKQGSLEARAHAVLTVLRVRGIPVPDAERERILAEKDPDRLERWLERAIVEMSLAAVLDEPS
jgi:hypothetical protein